MDKLRQLLAQGQALVLPTETVYGLFSLALSEEAVNHVYELKERPRDKAMNLNVASLEDIYRYSKDHPTYLDELYQAFLPGPLTLILKANERVPNWINSGLKTVGFRVPAYEPTLELIAEFGPLIGPSANKSGLQSGTHFQAIMEQFGGQLEGISDDRVISGQDSTILDLSGPYARILRQGSISKAEIQEKVPDIQFEEERK